MKKKSTNKKYIVSFDMRWSHEVKVTAKNKWEARRKAFVKFIRMLTQKEFRIDVDLDE